MKKFIALVLTIVMVCSAAAVVVSAAGTGESTLEAPVFVGAQTTAANNGFCDIRFVSTVNSLEGDKLGFDIAATYADGTTGATTRYYGTWTNGNGEECTTESTAVYTSIIADGNEVTAKSKGGEYFYLYTMRNVPVDMNIVFTVKAYIVDGEEEIASEAKFRKYADGTVTKMETTPSQEYDIDLLEAAGVSKPYGGSMKAAVSSTGTGVTETFNWGTGGQCFLEFVSNNSLKDVIADGGNMSSSYVFTTNLTITTHGVLGFYFNNDPSDHTANKTGYTKDRTNATFISVRQGVYKGTDELPANRVVKESSNFTYSNGAVDTTKNILIRYQIHDAAGGISSDYVYVSELAGTSTIKLTVVVNNSYNDGCKFDVYLNDTYAFSVEGDAAHRVSNNSNIMAWTQNTVFTANDMTIGKVADDTTITSGTIPVVEKTWEAPLTTAKALATKGYTVYNPVSGKAGPGVSIDNGTLKIEGGGWGNNYLVISDNILTANEDTFVAEMDMYITSISTLSLSVCNTALPDNATVNNVYDSILGTGESIRLLNGSTDSKMKIYLQGGKTNNVFDETSQKTIDVNFEDSQKKINVRLVVSGSLYSVFIDGKHVVTHAPSDERGPNADTSLIVWAQTSTVAIDNLKITTLA